MQQLCSSKDGIKKVKKTSQKNEQNIATHMTEKGLICRINKTYIQKSIGKKHTTQKKNGQETYPNDQ